MKIAWLIVLPLSVDVGESPTKETACCAMEAPYLELRARVKSLITSPRNALTAPRLNMYAKGEVMRDDSFTSPVELLFSRTVVVWCWTAQFL